MESIAGSSSSSCLSPARSGCISSDDIFKDGSIDLKQLNYILRNPELPKSKHKINTILKQYNEEKCRAITLHRINYKSRDYQNIDNNNYIIDNRIIRDTNNDCIDLDELSEYEVKLSQLPHELLVSILGETFAKYQTEINRRNEQNLDTNSTSNTNGVCVKQEVLSDNESDCEISFQTLNINNNINELKIQLKKLITDYESVEKEEKSVSNNLQIVTKELENKLSALRECIALCEMFKEQNLVMTQKLNELKNQKSELKNQMKEIKEKLIQLNQSYHNSIGNNNCVNSMISNECVTETVERNVLTQSHSNDKQNDTNVSINTEIVKTNHLSKAKHKKRKVVPKNVSKNNRKENQITEDNEINESEIEIISDSFEGKNSKLRKLSINKKDDINKDSNLRPNHKNADQSQNIGHTSVQTIVMEDNQNLSKDESESNDLKTDEVTGNDWIDNYVNSSFISFSAQSSSSHNPSSPQMRQNSISTSFPTPNPMINRNPLPSGPRFINRNNNNNNNNWRRDGFNRNTQNNFEVEYGVTHHIKSVSEIFIPHVSSLYTFKNELWVGLQCGSINKYLIESNGLKFLLQYPNLNSMVDALYYNEKYNYLYCGTRYGLFAYFNNGSNDLNNNTVNLKVSITCFESSATILYIGSIDGIINRFGLMSNQMINNFKCLNEPIIGLKLINDLTEQNRIIVCGKTEISIRNSSDGSLLHTLDKNGFGSEFVGSDLYSNKIMVCTNLITENFHRLYLYDENVRSITNNFHFKSTVILMTMCENFFYIYTADKKLYCFNCETFSIEWITHVRINRIPTSISVSNKKVILGMIFGNVVIINPDQNSPIICQFSNCEARFPRMSDIFNHFYYNHAMPFFRKQCNYNDFFYCSWNGCQMRIKNTKNSIFEHLKSHVN